MTDQHKSTEPVDITGKHFDAEKGEWVEDPATDTSATDEKSSEESAEAPGDRLAEQRAEDHNENGTEGR